MKKVVVGALFAALGYGAFAPLTTIAALAGMEETCPPATVPNLQQLEQEQQLKKPNNTRQQLSAVKKGRYAADTGRQGSESSLARYLTAEEFAAYTKLLGAGAAAPGIAGKAQHSRRLQQEQADSNIVAAPLDGRPDSKQVKVAKRVVKIESEDGEMKIKPRKEKVVTAEGKYKADRDETKFKSHDGTIKVKREQGKAKIETPQGKMKLEDGEVRVKPRSKRSVLKLGWL